MLRRCGGEGGRGVVLTPRACRKMKSQILSIVDPQSFLQQSIKGSLTDLRSEPVHYHPKN